MAPLREAGALTADFGHRARVFRKRLGRQDPAMRAAFVRGIVHRRLPLPFALRCLRALTGADARTLRGYLAEPDRPGAIGEHLDRALAEYLAVSTVRASGTMGHAEGRLLYALVRALRPEAVVETGTANGSSTALVLAALEANGTGRLVSIDLPTTESDDGVRPLVPGAEIGVWDVSPLPAGREPGWMVPEGLRGRWDLRLGDARTLLPAALSELGAIGLFFHDSLHEREHMLFELGAAWPYLVPGGVAAADDVFQRAHDALPAFARSVGRPLRTYGDLGFVPG